MDAESKHLLKLKAGVASCNDVGATTRLGLRDWLDKAGRLFPRNNHIDSVSTKVMLAGAPDEVWQQILFYEEVPTVPPRLLQILLPYPVRTEGDKGRPGARVRCVYDGGTLV